MKLINGLFAMMFGMTGTQAVYANTEGFIVLDVRTPAEYSDGHVKDAMNIDIFADDFKKRVDKLDRNKIYKVYCRSGNRSGQATSIMKQMGFKDVENIGGVGQAAKRLQREIVKP